MSVGSNVNKTKGFPLDESVSKRRSARCQQQFIARMSGLDRQEMTKSFISAIRSFDIDTVEKFLQTDFAILEYRNHNLHSVLHFAVAQIGSDNYKEKSGHLLKPLNGHKFLKRIVEVLIMSGKVTMNSLNGKAETALHVAVYSCKCKEFSSNAYKDMVNDIIEVLLKNHANANAKDCDGVTPLMTASSEGCTHIVQLLLDWRDEHDLGVDLNTRDIFGETALIKASTNAHVGVIELLLQHGCLDKFQDRRGFYALHQVINGASDLVSNASRDFLTTIGELAMEDMQVVLDRYATHSRKGKLLRNGWSRNESIQKTVSLLVTRGRADINAKDFSGNTVLDLALKSKLHISQKTVETLKEYGARPTSCIVLDKQPEYPNTALQFTDKLGKTPLHRLFSVLPEVALREKIAFFDFEYLLNSGPHKEVFEAMTVAKDHRGRTVLHYAFIPEGTNMALKSEDILQFIDILKLKSTINERDNYGRTPLHYCQVKDVYESLVKQGADEHILDNDGKSPRDLNKLRNEERNRYNLPEKLKTEINQEKIDAWIIWTEANYAHRDQLSKQICDKVRQFMNRLAEEVGKKDPRFECKPVLVGSAGEGTKTGLPDEFDYNFILTKLSALCEVVPSPEAPSGFAHLKRSYTTAEFLPKNQQGQLEFDGFFNSSNFLLTTDLVSRFRTLYLQVMGEPEYWAGESFFEWDPHNEAGMIYDKNNREFNVSRVFHEYLALIHPCTTLQLKLNRPIDGKYMFTPISVDIVPCVKLNGWWPEQALSSVSSEIKLEGCHLMFEPPQRNYQWVPVSDPYAKISFAPAEGRAIRECSAVARAAYMVGKELLQLCNRAEFSYVLKTCLLYCIEALKDHCSRNSLEYEEIDPRELRCFVENLMLCFHEFYRQDFLPCYMMPSFHLPVEYKLKSTHEMLLYDSDFEYDPLADQIYSSVCASESPADCFPPTPEPLNEKFNRDELMRKLSMDKSCIELRSVLQASILTEEVVRSGGSQVRLSNKRKRRRANASKTKVKRRDLRETK